MAETRRSARPSLLVAAVLLGIAACIAGIRAMGSKQRDASPAGPSRPVAQGDNSVLSDPATAGEGPVILPPRAPHVWSSIARLLRFRAPAMDILRVNREDSIGALSARLSADTVQALVSLSGNAAPEIAGASIAALGRAAPEHAGLVAVTLRHAARHHSDDGVRALAVKILRDRGEPE